MTALATTYKDWQALTQRLNACAIGWQPQALVPMCVTVNQARLTADEALTFMADACADQGWCQQPSALLSLPADAQRATQQVPLLAEGVRSGHSWKLRHLNGDIWLLVHVDYQKAVTVEDATHLAEQVSHLSHHGRKAELGYLRLWLLDDDGKPQLDMAILETVAGGTQ